MSYEEELVKEREDYLKRLSPLENKIKAMQHQCLYYAATDLNHNYAVNLQANYSELVVSIKYLIGYLNKYKKHISMFPLRPPKFTILDFEGVDDNPFFTYKIDYNDAINLNITDYLHEDYNHTYYNYLMLNYYYWQYYEALFKELYNHKSKNKEGDLLTDFIRMSLNSLSIGYEYSPDYIDNDPNKGRLINDDFDHGQFLFDIIKEAEKFENFCKK